MEITSIKQLRSISEISRAIHKADAPEELVKELPTQTIYQVILHNGLESSIELIELFTPEQLRVILDFDLWANDHIDEENLWNWLELSSEEDELTLLQKIIGSLDLKIVALLINKYLEVEQREEPTDASPGPFFFSPDKGQTWIRVLCEDQRKHFLISKLLAFLFESNPDVFYQLLATKAITTPTLLEEEAFNDRSKRLSANGFPDIKFALEVTSFLSVAEALKNIEEKNKSNYKQEVVIIESLARLSEDLEPLSSALKQSINIEETLSEISLITNALIVRAQARLADNSEVSFIMDQAHGALNLGLELLSKRSGINAAQILNSIGLQIPFRVGLTQIFDIGKQALRYETVLKNNNFEVPLATKSLLELLKRNVACLPASLSKHKSDYTVSEDERLDTKPSAFRYISEIEHIKAMFLNESNNSSTRQ